MTEQEYINKVKEVLKHRPDALAFLNLYSTYCHRIDDIIDCPDKRADSAFIIDTFMLAEELYSSNFFQQYYVQLYPTMLLISNNYKMSVKIEEKQNKEVWEAVLQDVLRHAAHDMVALVIYIVTGDKALMHQMSAELREVSMSRDCALQLQHDIETCR